jgi:serine/threonine-protein kinase
VLRKGDIIGGKYRVERMLGLGGMGRVIAARHIELGQLVALKILLEHVSRDPAAVERFLREARATVRLTSDHVCRVFDVGALDDGCPYIVMEYLEGATLAELPTPMPWEEVVELGIQACDALSEAHAIGIVHRDIKPANLFVAHRARGKRTLKVLDFGISKCVARMRGDVSLTHADQLLGSPKYMSPEQFRASKDIDGRADLWSLGVTLYQCLTGRVPFESESIVELASFVLGRAPVPLLAHAPHLPPELAEILDRCLRRDPAERYRSADDLARDLDLLLARHRSAHPPPPSSTSLPSGVSQTSAPPAPAARSRWLAPMLVAISLGVAAGAAIHHQRFVAAASPSALDVAPPPDPTPLELLPPPPPTPEPSTPTPTATSTHARPRPRPAPTASAAPAPRAETLEDPYDDPPEPR